MVVPGRHVLRAEIQERDELPSLRLLDKALVAFRHAMAPRQGLEPGEQYPKQDELPCPPLHCALL